MAAVSPAGPDPTMTTSRTSLIASPLRRGVCRELWEVRLRRSCSCCGLSLPPGERSSQHADSPECHPRHPCVVIGSRQLVVGGSQGSKYHDEQDHHRAQNEERTQQPEDDHAGDSLCGHDGAIAHVRDGARDEIGRLGCPVSHVVSSSSARGYGGPGSPAEEVRESYPRACALTTVV